ncbi:hypothetical protein [Sideroxydans lithotrophicus]|uniref:Outer membrane protein beta-barrel domain-containing protein n=1 Tax=Sideroxydans lithotrophicus (strain ES-1) TaxID=580332 RepID=D5CPM8_SIDLE|nr:hypothetical protein [Sideroxydans lithotrophicus]ADE13023.1 hypothetical protein Slit_2798 [Sideroxydans lithotrophicus ES-1]
MNRSLLLALVFIAPTFNAFADDQSLVYVAAGTGTGKANLAIGAGTTVDVLEVSSIDLGKVGGNYTVKFQGLSLVQNAVPVKNMNLMFRVGLGKTTTTFTSGLTASRTGIGSGVIFGLGAQYHPLPHLAFRGEVNRITYATAPDGSSHAATYPVTISALYIF